jgi:3-oxoacyl-(acyl-carrier-protein) synthase
LPETEDLSEPISITAISSISALGTSLEDTWAAYQSPNHHFVKKEFNGNLEWVSPLSEKVKQEVFNLRQSDTKYKMLDDSVLFAIYASRKAMTAAQWKAHDNFGINIGSSRGATSLFEKYHKEFIQKKRTATLASPTTTLGNISSWVAHDLQTQGPEISHSITCSTALHALLNGVAWIKSGMADKFLVGGSEAPLTPFTIAQMKALKIYAKATENISSRPCLAYGQEESSGGSKSLSNYPCKALNLEKKQNTMVLGEGASLACLEIGVSKKALAVIEGLGYATEVLEHNVSISTDANCFQRSMRMALGNIKPEEVDVIVMHAPGTTKGDMSEYKAIQKVFGSNMPSLTTNKWKVGHTFGASGMLSIELGVVMLQHQKFVPVPFAEHQETPKQLKRIMVNAVGFGGNAVSVLLTKNEFPPLGEG